MSGLLEKDPKIEQVVDRQTGRNLLDPACPDPLIVDLTAGRPQRFALTVKNGQEGLIEIAVSTDERWLCPEKTNMTLVGGESGDCIFSANVDGTADLANILFSWEGQRSTLCQSLVVMRRLPAGQVKGDKKEDEGTGDDASDRGRAIERVVKFIDACGKPDKFIDTEEEYQIFRKGGDLDLSTLEIESILNRRCAEEGWTRQKRLSAKMKAMLREAARPNGLVRKEQFELVVNFAVKRGMPRKAADEHCLTLMLNSGLKPKKRLFDNWPAKKLKRHGL